MHISIAVLLRSLLTCLMWLNSSTASINDSTPEVTSMATGTFEFQHFNSFSGAELSNTAGCCVYLLSSRENRSKGG